MNTDPKIINKAATTLWDYMRLNHDVNYADLEHTLPKTDAILVLGSHDLRVAAWAVDMYKHGRSDRLIFSGGYGTITQQRFGKPEAQEFADIARQLGVSEDAIIIEDASTNTGENIIFTHRLLQERDITIKSLILVQKPYMERRAYSAFKKQWPDPDTVITTASAPMTFEMYCTKRINKDSVINIMVGDLLRIREYPKLGFQIEQEIPENVWRAYEELVAAGYDKRLIKTRDM